MRPRPFQQIDVFTETPYRGNPVAVVLDAEGLDESAMARFARWTNLSETTFVLPPTRPDADYRLRIFTPSGELPFAGHPTLGSCQGWLSTGAAPKVEGLIVQECGIGAVRIRHDAGRLAFAAPEPRRTGPVDAETARQIGAGLRIGAEKIRAMEWADNGPGWIGVLLDSADTVLSLEPDFAAMGNLRVGVAGLHGPGGPTDLEVRAFVPGLGVPEDPVTGSLNAALAQWLLRESIVTAPYQARQGTALGRDGRIYIDAADGDIWVGGHCTPCIHGTVTL